MAGKSFSRKILDPTNPSLKPILRILDKAERSPLTSEIKPYCQPWHMTTATNKHTKMCQ